MEGGAVHNRCRHRSALSTCSHHHLTCSSTENIELLMEEGAVHHHRHRDPATPGQSVSRLSLPRHSVGPRLYSNKDHQSQAESSSGVEMGASGSSHVHGPSRENGEFMLLSAETFHQLHPNVTSKKNFTALQWQNNLTNLRLLGAPPPDPGCLAARMKLGALPPRPPAASPKV